MKHEGKRIPIPFKISKIVTKWSDFPLCSEVNYKVGFFFLLQLFGEWDGKETDN